MTSFKMARAAAAYIATEDNYVRKSGNEVARALSPIARARAQYVGILCISKSLDQRRQARECAAFEL